MNKSIKEPNSLRENTLDYLLLITAGGAAQPQVRRRITIALPPAEQRRLPRKPLFNTELRLFCHMMSSNKSRTDWMKISSHLFAVSRTSRHRSQNTALCRGEHLEGSTRRIHFTLQTSEHERITTGAERPIRNYFKDSFVVLFQTKGSILCFQLLC